MNENNVCARLLLEIIIATMNNVFICRIFCRPNQFIRRKPLKLELFVVLFSLKNKIEFLMNFLNPYV